MIANLPIIKEIINFYGEEVTDFYDNKILKVDSNHTSLAVINFDTGLKKDENYYPQAFLKECTYTEQKIIRHIKDDLSGFSSSDESDEE